MINPRKFLESLTPEQAKAFALDYLAGSKPGEQEKIIDLDRLKTAMQRLFLEVDKRFITRSQIITLSKGQKVINTGLTNLGDYVEVYLNGTRLYPGDQYTVDNASGQITLATAVEYSVDAYVVDSRLNPKANVANADTLQGRPLSDFIVKENFTQELLKMRRYSVKQVVGGTTEINTGVAPLSGRPTVICNGIVLALGTDYNLTNRDAGIITLPHPPAKDFTIMVEDMVFGPGQEVSNCHTIDGVTLENIVRGERVFEFKTLNEAKAAQYLKVNDRIRVWGGVAIGDSYVMHYLVVNTADDNIAMTNGLYLKNLVTYVQHDNSILEAGISEYTSVVKNLSPNTEVYLDGKRLIYGLEWTIVDAALGKIRFTHVTGAKHAVYIVNNTITRTTDLTTLNNHTADDFVKGRRMFEFTNMNDMKSARNLADGDRLTVWGDVAMGDTTVSHYTVGIAPGLDTIALSDGFYAKPVYQPVVKPLLGDVPSEWFDVNTGTLDLHGYTHVDLTQSFVDVVGEIFIKKIINAPKYSRLCISRSGVGAEMFLEMKSSSKPDVNIIGSEYIEGNYVRVPIVPKGTIWLDTNGDSNLYVDYRATANSNLPSRALMTEKSVYEQLVELDTPRHAYKMRKQKIYELYTSYLDAYEAFLKGTNGEPNVPKELIEYIKSV